MRKSFVLFLVLALMASEMALLPAAAKKSERGAGHVLPSEQQYDIGMSKFKSGDYDGAIDAFKQSIYYARNEYMPQAYYWLGVCYKIKHEDAKAIDALGKHLTQSVGFSPEANVHLGEILLRNNRLDEAEDQAKQALDGNREIGYNLWGKVLVAKGEYENASGQFLNALGETPWTYYEAWMNYVNLMIKRKAWTSALRQLTGMLQSPKELKGIDYEDIHLKRGLCYIAIGDHQNALENWHKVLSYNPKNCEAHLQLAMMFDMEKHVSSAIKEYKEFARLSTEQERVEPVKQRIQFLEQALAPKAAEPAAPAPSAYMRQQEAARRAAEQQAQSGLQPHDSGF